MGSRGIFRSDTREEALDNYEKTMAATGKDYCLVEEFIEGTLFGIEGMVYSGEILFLLPNNTEGVPGGHAQSPSAIRCPLPVRKRWGPRPGSRRRKLSGHWDGTTVR